MWEKIFDELSSSPSMDAVSYKKLAKVFISEVLSAEVSDLLEHVEKYNALCEDIRTLMHAPYIFHTKKFGLLLRDPIEHIERVLASKVSSLFSKNVRLAARITGPFPLVRNQSPRDSYPTDRPDSSIRKRAEKCPETRPDAGLHPGRADDVRLAAPPER